MKKIYVSGNGNVTWENFHQFYIEPLKKLNLSEYEFIIGDFSGTDTLMMEFLKDKSENVTIVQVEEDIFVCNMIGQHKTITNSKGILPIRYEAVEKCLEKLANEALKLKASIHMPRIGCGLAGGKWEEIEPIIERTLLKNNVEVYVYDFE
ncbi:hypothetical protein [Chryseobacterium scophthalmum]|uniref:hypothetical protein n=1 Tax=Chryseobacterium scophthalmum TaxID=59733 RepID=UPI001AEBAE07|nr:hypothetical protein [Chryseobacterium scophthalmum]